MRAPRAQALVVAAAVVAAAASSFPAVALAEEEVAATASAAPVPAPGAAPAIEADAAEVERLHRDSIGTRRTLADVVLVAGIASAAGGGALMITDASDEAFRYAGINTAVFGVVNTIVATVALHGIAREEAAWDAPEAARARRTPDGLARARIHAALDERRESVSHAINLGLAAAYLGVAGTAVLASQLGVEHPDRWLASGIAIGAQAVFLVAIDTIGMTRAARFHRGFIEGLAPTVSLTPSASGFDARAGLTLRF